VRHLLNSGSLRWLAADLVSQETELVTFRVGQYVPSLIAVLTDICQVRTSSQEPCQLALLVTVSRADVEVHTELAGFRGRARLKDDRGLETAEPGIWRPDLDAALGPLKLNEPSTSPQKAASRAGS
jgi:hypothetical protein